jgi:hypothetical protein
MVSQGYEETFNGTAWQPDKFGMLHPIHEKNGKSDYYETPHGFADRLAWLNSQQPVIPALKPEESAYEARET